MSLQTEKNNENRGFGMFATALFLLGLAFFVIGTFLGITHPSQNKSHLISIGKGNYKPQKFLDTDYFQNNNDFDKTVFNSQNIDIPANQRIRIGVFGDSMADGLWAGLYRELDGKFDLYQFSKQATGLSNYDYFDTAEEAQTKIAQKPIDIAIILTGTNDETGIMGRNSLTPYGSPKWDKAYQERIDELIAIFKKKHIAVYWVGLPIMRDKERQLSARKFGGFYANAAQRNEISFIDTAKATADPNGKYNDKLMLPFDKMPRDLRNKDGVHFKMEGYRLLALPVIKVLNRDLSKYNITITPKSLQKSTNQTTNEK